MAELDDSGYSFTSIPTKLETQRFEYVAFDYIASNPGIIDGQYLSYVGVYFAANGQLSGTYFANSQIL